METDQAAGHFSGDDTGIRQFSLLCSSFTNFVCSLFDEGCPSSADLEFVASRIVGKWRSLAWQLGVPEEKIEAADSNNPTDVVRKAADVLNEWKKIRGRSATWAELENALNGIGQECIIEGK